MPRFVIALVILLLGSCVIVAQAPVQDSSITITGIVQSQGKPISGALITLWQQGTGGDPSEQGTVAAGRTDSAGSYDLKNVPTGNYYIGVKAPGYVTGHENNSLEKLRFVTVVGGKTLNPFNFELVREGVIRGAVTDVIGKPIANLPITLIADVFPNGVPTPKYAENLRTDDQGHYRVSGMPAGKYRIAAGHWPLLNGTILGRQGYRRVFYPNAVDETGARTFDISPGSEINDINFNLGEPTKTFTVRARIVDERGKPLQGLPFTLVAFLKDKRIGGRGFGEAKSNDSGEIVLPDLPPGEYSIQVPGGKGYFRKDEPQTPNYFGESQHFEVVDKNVTDIEIRVTKAASVAGFVIVQGPAGADVLARIREISLSGIVETKPMTPSPMLHAAIRPDGSFLFTGLKAGRLKLFSPYAGKALPLSLVRIERDGTSIEGLDINLGDELTGVKVVVAYANSGVHGVVKLEDGSVPAGLIGMATVQGNVLGNRSVVNQNGEFILQNLIAGEYELVVTAHDAMGRNWQVRQKIKIDDDKVSEAKLELDSKVKPNPDAASKSYLQP